MTAPTRHPSRQAMSLLEIIIASAILSGIMLTVSQAMRAGSSTASELSSSAERSSDAARILHDIAMELRSIKAKENYITDDLANDILTMSYETVSYLPTPESPPPVGESFEAKYTNYRQLVFDRSAGTLTKVVDNRDPFTNTTIERYELTLATNLASDGFSVNHLGYNNTIHGNRLLLSLTLQDDVNDRLRTTTAERIVFIRSYLANNDDRGIDPVTDPLSSPNGPRLIWSEDQRSDPDTNEFLIVIKVKSLDGWDLMREYTTVEFIDPESTYALDTEYGWLTSGTGGLQDDEIRISGTLDGSIRVKVTCYATDGNERAMTIETNDY